MINFTFHYISKDLAKRLTLYELVTIKYDKSLEVNGL